MKNAGEHHKKIILVLENSDNDCSFHLDWRFLKFDVTKMTNTRKESNPSSSIVLFMFISDHFHSRTHDFPRLNLQLRKYLACIFPSSNPLLRRNHVLACTQRVRSHKIGRQRSWTTLLRKKNTMLICSK